MVATEIKEFKKNQSEMKNATAEIGNRLDLMNSRLSGRGGENKK